MYMQSNEKHHIFVYCQCAIKDGGGAVILLLTSAQYLSGIPASFSSASFLCFISDSLACLKKGDKN